MDPGNLGGELYDFIFKFGGLNWKKLKTLCRQASKENLKVYIEILKLVWNPHVDEPLRKILKHQIQVDNKTWWLVPVSFLYDNLYWNK